LASKKLSREISQRGKYKTGIPLAGKHPSVFQAGQIRELKNMNTYKNPTWWTKENDSSWENVKAAMKRDWDQTKHDLGGKEPDTNQKTGNTVRQAEGKEAIPPRHQPAYDEGEPASRFGHGARTKYGKEHQAWNDGLENRLKSEWEQIEPSRKQTWMQDRAAIRYGWEFKS
jgi:hypothetical protein